jgi:hypothetical protein
MTRKLIALLAGAALFALPAALAGADGTAPTPCAGMFYTDPAGDASYFDVNADLGSPGNPNEDIRGLFFNYRDGLLTANIVVENLDKTESGAKYATATKWEVKFTSPEDGENYYAKAVTDGSAWSYELEHIKRVGTGQVVDPGQYVVEELKGSAAEGPMGVLTIEIPSTVPGVKLGAKLAGVTVTAIPRDSVQQPGLFTDDAPETAKDYTVTECPAPVAAAPVAPVAVETPAAPAAEAPAPAAAAPQPAAAPAPAAPAKAKAKAKPSCKAKAKKLKNAKKRKAALKKCAKKSKKKR